MRRTLAALAALALAGSPAALHAQDDPGTTTTTVITTQRDAARAAVQQDFSRLTDAEFLQRAALAGIMEVASSKVADGKVQSEAVQQFARRMVDDHNRANRELVSLAESKGIDIPKTLDDQRKAALDRMGEMDGPALEREYVRMQLDSHREAVALHAAAAERVQDAEIKAFAQKQLPILRQHLQMVERIAGVAPADGAATTTTTTPDR